jgi:hypothetical protein
VLWGLLWLDVDGVLSSMFVRQKYNNVHSRLAFSGPTACEFRQNQPMSAVGEKETMT